MVPVVILAAARNDLLQQGEYYDSQGGYPLGDRFFANCESAFNRLGIFPESGTPVRLRHPKLRDCRFVLVPDFDSMLIFYRISRGEVQIVRVLHGARDIERVLDEDTDHSG